MRCYQLTSKLPKTEIYGLTSQIQRAAVSIRSNIAEGKGRNYLGDYIRHLSIANGSLKELETHLIIVGRLAYSYSTFIGEKIKRKGISEYVVRPQEKGRSHKRHSNFSIGLNALNFLDGISFFQKQIEELMSLFPLNICSSASGSKNRHSFKRHNLLPFQRHSF